MNDGSRQEIQKEEVFRGNNIGFFEEYCIYNVNVNLKSITTGADGEWMKVKMTFERSSEEEY